MGKGYSWLMGAGLLAAVALLCACPLALVLWPPFTQPSPPTPSPTPARAAVCKSGNKWSPDRRYCAEVFSEGPFFVIDEQGGRVAWVPRDYHRDGSFEGWTHDGRFAVFTAGDQYGNGETLVFDTQAWKLVWPLEPISMDCHNPERWCEDYPVAMAPHAPFILMKNGKLLDLTLLQSRRVVTNANRYLWDATWSSNGAYLALATSLPGQNGFEVILATGDGTPIHTTELLSPLAHLRSLTFTSGGQEATLRTEAGTYVMEVPSGRVAATTLPR